MSAVLPPPQRTLAAAGARPATAIARTARAADRLFWAWTVGFGVLLFATVWGWRGGWWQRLVDADPSGISIGILVITLVVTLWAGLRSNRLARQCGSDTEWSLAYRAARVQAPGESAQLLADQVHGPHEIAWWFAGATIKLGLLGTVVGFIVMAGQLTSAQSFDTSQIQALMAQMTRGMAIALVTTFVGLVANLLLGVQLMLLDRMADRVVATIIEDGALRPTAN